MFESQPKRLAVIRVLIENGLGVRNGKIYCNQLEVDVVEVAKAAGVDRRTVTQTIKAIETNPELNTVFKYLRSAGHSLREVAKYLGFSVLEITPTDAKTPGILAKTANLLAEKGISIRQALVDDPDLHPEPRLSLIVKGEIPGEIVSKALKIKGVARVSVY
jgi:hypothetical protein